MKQYSKTENTSSKTEIKTYCYFEMYVEAELVKILLFLLKAVLKLPEQIIGRSKFEEP